MQETGIVRRIDELGRVVIPKEMRKVLRIKEGAPLEIYAEKDYLIFKKYSPIISITTYANSIADSIEEMTEKVCLITDNDNVIYASKGKLKDFIGKPISQEMEKILKERKSIVINKTEGGTVIPVIDGQEKAVENLIVVPIVSAGDCFGSVILLDNEKTSRFSPSDVKFVGLGATLLSKQFD